MSRAARPRAVRRARARRAAGRARHRRERAERPEGHAPGAAGGFGHDAAWADDFHHALRALLTGDRDGYYAEFGHVAQLAKAFRRPHVHDGEYSTFRRRRFGAPADDVPPAAASSSSSANHDQVGNRAFGDRLPREVRGARRDRARCCRRSSRCCSWARSTASARRSSSSPTTSTRTSRRPPARGAGEEFAAFAAFSGEEVPDPQAPETFERSKLTRAWPTRRSPTLYRRMLRAAARAAAAAIDATRIALADADVPVGWLQLRREPRGAVDGLVLRLRREWSGEIVPRPGLSVSDRVSRDVWPGRPFPLGPTWDGQGTNFSLFSEHADARRAVPVRRRRPRGAHRGRRAHGAQLALLPAGRRPRPALRLPRPRPVRARGGPPLQPGQAAHRPLRQGDRGRRRLGRGQHAALHARPSTRRTPTSSPTTRTPRPRSPSRWSSTRGFDWEGDARPRTPWNETVIYETHVKGFTKRHPEVREDLRGTYAGLASEPAIALPQGPRRHRGRAAADPPHRRRELPAPSAGLTQLLGLQLDRLPRAARRATPRPAPPASRCASSRGWSRRCTARASR